MLRSLNYDKINNVFLKRNTKVELKKELPADKRFGNHYKIPAGKQGYIVSDGFVEGMISIRMLNYPYPDETISCNILSAKEYFDVYLIK